MRTIQRKDYNVKVTQAEELKSLSNSERKRIGAIADGLSKDERKQWPSPLWSEYMRLLVANDMIRQHHIDQKAKEAGAWNALQLARTWYEKALFLLSKTMTYEQLVKSEAQVEYAEVEIHVTRLKAMRSKSDYGAFISYANIETMNTVAMEHCACCMLGRDDARTCPVRKLQDEFIRKDIIGKPATSNGCQYFAF